MEELFSKYSLTQAKAISYIIFGCALIAIGPFFVEFSGVEAITSSFYRLFIGAIAFLLIAALRKEKLPQCNLLWLYCSAGLMTTLDLVTCNQSILYIGSGLSTVLSNLEVIFLIMLGFLLYKETLPPLFFLPCVLLLFGVYCLLRPYYENTSSTQYLGIIYALTASLIYSIYLLLLKKIEQDNPNSSPATTLGIVCFFGTIILGGYMYYTSSATFLLHDRQSALYVFSYSVVSQIFGWWFITNGLSKVSLSMSGLLFLTQPALTFIGDCLFLGRNTHTIQLLGGTVLLSAICLITVIEKRKESIA